ncbi:GTPase, putative [Plasmodium gallinaceum]|uniref:GTPase, putative n=1 Tax=Plasmodium gallinaceum TaxID=5849 RepID=A0A1J1GX38_PLAGA|nr:GTPase, putative [Plasmodium gallinaceum]CRG95861.1 GTPase, putative [Plasmodium gallinaceum]
MLKNILLNKINTKFNKGLYVRHFSILERYIRARPYSNELKINEESVNEEIKDENKKKDSKYYPPNITRGVIPKSAYMNIWKIPEQPENPKFLKIALIGPPNAGKSSLLNSILNKTISAVSPKINTTRQDIKGIYTKDNVQLIFIDAPGVIPSHKKKKFCKELVSYAWKGYEEADLVLFIVDTVKRPTNDIISIVRMLAPKRVDTDSSESEEENNEYDSECNNYRENLNENNINNYNEENIEGNEKKQNNNAISNNQNHEDIFLKEKDENKKLEEKFIKYFSGKMQNDLNYSDKSIKENIFDNRKKIIESYYDTQNINKNEKKVIPPVILVLNKVDLCTHNKWANARAKEFMNNGDFDNIFFISAKYNKGVEELLDYIIKYKAKNHLWIYPKDTSTTLTKVQIVEQLINTYLYCWFNKDVPYKIKHHMLSWCVNLNNCLIIEYQIIVKSEKVAKMICGVHNKLIINMRKNVSYKLTKLWGKNVYVHIHVKSVNV